MKALLALLLLFPAPGVRGAEVEITLKDREGETLCSVHTRGASLEEILSAIASRTGRELTGLDGAAPAEPLPVWLDERPLAYVVQTVAACGGYRAHVGLARIELRPDLGREDGVEAFEEQCSVAYLRALKAHPEHEFAAEGEMVLGEIQERRGNLRAANGHYQLVASRHERSKEAPDALLRSGLVFERLGDWNSALQQFSALANLPQAHPWQPRARLEIARCMAQSGDGRQALFILDALEKLFPATLTSERQSRLYVRARALLASKRESDALEMLRRADELGRSEEWETDAMELRAEALAHFGRNAESARAWLAFAQRTKGEEQLRAWVRAAQQSLEAGDLLGVLFVQRLAQGTRAASAIEVLAEDARKQLGLAREQDTSLDGDVLAQARQYVAQGLARQAVALLEPVYLRREEQAAEQRLEIVTLYARALAAEKDVDTAVDVLRRNLASFEAVEARRRILGTAGDLYEAAERYDEAVRAFGGEL